MSGKIFTHRTTGVEKFFRYRKKVGGQFDRNIETTGGSWTFRRPKGSRGAVELREN